MVVLTHLDALDIVDLLRRERPGRRRFAPKSLLMVTSSFLSAHLRPAIVKSPMAPQTQSVNSRPATTERRPTMAAPSAYVRSLEHKRATEGTYHGDDHDGDDDEDDHDDDDEDHYVRTYVHMMLIMMMMMMLN